MIANAALTAQWQTTLDKVTNELKEMGDLSNWSESIVTLAEEVRDLAKRIQGS